MADLHHRPRSAPKTAQTLDFIGYRGACPQFFPILIDTNVFVSALWSANPASPTFRTYHAMLTQLFVPLYSDEIIAEYEDVLYHSKFGFDARQADEIIDLVRRFGERITPAEQGDEIFPDPDDWVEPDYLEKLKVHHVPQITKEEEEAYRSKYTEVAVYKAVIAVLERWIELHGK